MDGTLQLRDYFYAGFNNYCLNNYKNIEEEEEKKEADEYIYQIYMISNIKKDFILSLKYEKNENLYLLYLYYKYYYLNEKEDVLSELKNLKISSTNGNILKSRILFDNDLLDECFDLLEDGTVEVKAAKIFFLLSINRNDLVKEIINEYLKMNDEIPIIKIALAIYYLYNDNYKESFLIFDDLESLYSSVVNDFSTIILNGKSVSNIISYEFNDAKEYLKNAIKNEINNSDILYNLITCSLYLYELDEAEEYLKKLYDFFPVHDSISVLRKIDYEVDNFVCEF
ncbi:coatomer epsilon subunit, putative [Plasmodium gallinaceum]|uniref:Coatomer epsilon subunit, putative n=1 Tax=Plasmodium gallinaceum TaxID=5849 RepID=A0A1J1H400_PLAGA|nr:coatomer epsilon subunit, putative [Plasmodium gallinaceum]CRG98082.1 coatomer epsilon subunit, putative [Plasmodium gallinaceum]